MSTLTPSTVERLPDDQILDQLEAGLKILIVSSSGKAYRETHRRLAERARNEFAAVRIRWANGEQEIAHPISRGWVKFRSHRSPGVGHGLVVDVVYLDRVPGEDRDHLLDVLVSLVPTLAFVDDAEIVQCNYPDDQWAWPIAEGRAV